MMTDNRRHTACTVAISGAVLLALSLMWSPQTCRAGDRTRIEPLR